MESLGNLVGIDKFNDAEIVLPTKNPRPSGTSYSIEELRDIKFAFYSQLEFDAVPLDITIGNFADPEQTYAFNNSNDRLKIARHLLDDHQDLVATTLQALSYFYIQSRADNEPDLFYSNSETWPWLSDLLPIFLGWGIFGANTTISTKKVTSGTWESWRVSKHRHLPSRMYGYALALFAWGHGQTSLTWTGILRPDAKEAFRKSINYLVKTNDTVFKPQNFRSWNSRTVDEFQQDLMHGSDSAKLATMWEIQTLDQRVRHRHEQSRKTAMGCVQQLKDLTYSKDEFVRTEALNCLALLGKDARLVSTEISRSLTDTCDTVRAAAVSLLGQLHEPHDTDLFFIAGLLSDNSEEVVYAAVNVLATFLPSDEHVLKNILTGLGKAMVSCNFELAELLGQLLAKSTDRAEQVVEQHFQNDPDLIEQAKSVLLPVDRSEDDLRPGLQKSSRRKSIKEEHDNWF